MTTPGRARLLFSLWGVDGLQAESVADAPVDPPPSGCGKRLTLRPDSGPRQPSEERSASETALDMRENWQPIKPAAVPLGLVCWLESSTAHSVCPLLRFAPAIVVRYEQSGPESWPQASASLPEPLPH